MYRDDPPRGLTPCWRRAASADASAPRYRGAYLPHVRVPERGLRPWISARRRRQHSAVVPCPLVCVFGAVSGSALLAAVYPCSHSCNTVAAPCACIVSSVLRHFAKPFRLWLHGLASLLLCVRLAPRRKPFRIALRCSPSVSGPCMSNVPFVGVALFLSPLAGCSFWRTARLASWLRGSRCMLLLECRCAYVSLPLCSVTSPNCSAS